MLRLGLGLGLNKIEIARPSALTSDWYARVLANGGIVTPLQVALVNALAQAYADAGLTDATCRFNPYCGQNLAAALVPVFRGGGPNIDTNVGFVAGNYSVSGGLVGGVGKHLNTGVDVTTLTGAVSTSWHHGVYSLDGASYSTAIDLAAVNGTTKRNLLFVNRTTTGARSDVWNSTTAAASYPTPAAGEMIRLVLGNRISTSNHRLYADGVQKATNGAGSGTMPNIPIFIHARNNSGVADEWTPRALGGYTFGLLIPTANVVPLSDAWKTYSEALGRFAA